MQPDVTVTEFLYSCELAEKPLRWYVGMRGVFATFCTAQPVTRVVDITTPLARHFFDAARQPMYPRKGQPAATQTVHGHARAVRAFLHWCVDEGLLDERVSARKAEVRSETPESSGPDSLLIARRAASSGGLRRCETIEAEPFAPPQDAGGPFLRRKDQSYAPDRAEGESPS